MCSLLVDSVESLGQHICSCFRAHYCILAMNKESSYLFPLLCLTDLREREWIKVSNVPTGKKLATSLQCMKPPTNPMCMTSGKMTVLNKDEAMQVWPMWGRVLSHWTGRWWPWSLNWLSVQCDTDGGQQVRQARLLFRKRVQSYQQGSTDLAALLSTLPISTMSNNSNLLS